MEQNAQLREHPREDKMFVIDPEVVVEGLLARRERQHVQVRGLHRVGVLLDVFTVAPDEPADV